MTRLACPDPPLTDGVVRLRGWEERDLGCVEQASSDPVIPEGTTVPPVFTPQAGRAWIHRQRERAELGEGLSLAIADAGSHEARGACVLTMRPQPGTAGIGYWVIEGARGRGLAARAVGLLAPWALRHAGLSRLEALVEPSNLPSRRVMEAAGFQREGCLRSFLVFATRRADALVYGLVPGDLRHSDEAPETRGAVEGKFRTGGAS